jgi:hypothetical protein
MEQKIQLLHPAGKHAVRIAKNKYNTIEKAVFSSLEKGELTHTEMLEAVTGNFKKYKINFEGSVEWYMESVKLHLEALKMIERVPDKSRLKFRLVKPA